MSKQQKNPIKETIKFKISKSDNYYTASAVDFFIVTQGKTFDELIYNIKEATELYFEDENLKKSDLISMPAISIKFNPKEVYA